MFQPIPFLYRFVRGKFRNGAEARQQTANMTKYFTTLGTYPTGREVPFRLDEFLENYKKQHIPEEVEEWLGCFVKDPVEAMVPSFQAFNKLLEATPASRARGFRKANVVNVPQLTAHLNSALERVGVEVPSIVVRSVVENPKLKEHVLDTVFDLQGELRQHGSTAHRRWLKQEMLEEAERAQAQLGSGGLPGDDFGRHITAGGDVATESTPVNALSSEVGGVQSAVRNLVDVPEETADDERLFVKLFTLFAEGAAGMDKPVEAQNMIAHASMFAHDNESRAAIHCNMSAAVCAQGAFKEAEMHAKEAVLRVQSPRAYANWAVATALQDRHDEALDICAKGLELFPGSETLVSTHQNLVTAIAGTTSTSRHPSSPGVQNLMPFQKQQAIRDMIGDIKHYVRQTKNAATGKTENIWERVDPMKMGERNPHLRRVGHLGGYHPDSTVNRGTG